MPGAGLTSDRLKVFVPPTESSAVLPVNAKDPAYGAVGDGTTDDTAAVQAALTAASNNVLLIPPGTYNIPSALTLPTGAVTVLAYGATFTRALNSNQWLSGGGTKTTIAGSGGVLTGNAVAGATTLAVTDASTISAGDYLNLRSTVAWPSGNGKYGEIVRVLSKSTNTLTLYGPIIESYATADSAIVDKLNLQAGVAIYGLTLQGTSNTGTNGGILLRYCISPKLIDITTRNLDNPGIQHDTCLAARTVRHNSYDLTDNVGANRIGYANNCNGASQDCRYIDCYSERVRHQFTSNGNADGVPHNNDVIDCHGVGATTTDFDTHEDGRGNRFINCTSVGSTGAFNMRAPDSELINPKSRGHTANGISIASTATRSQISNPRVVDNRSTSYGMSVAADDVVVNGGLIDNQNTGTSHCLFITGNKTAVLGTRLRNPAGGTGTCLTFSGTPTGHIIDVTCEDAAKGVDVQSATPTSIRVHSRNLSSYFIDGATFTGSLAQTITPGASPYKWTNNQGIEVDLQINGGTVSDLRRSNDDGANYTFIAGTSGTFRVAPGASIKVTYSVAPTMNFIPVRG